MKTIIIGILVVLLAGAIGFGGVWYFMGGAENQSHKRMHKASKKDHDAEAKSSINITATNELFGFVVPAMRNSYGQTPIVEADFAIVIPITQKFKADENNSKVRDVISTLIRESNIDDINSDNLAAFKITAKKRIHDETGLDIKEVLVLSYKYSMMHKHD